MADSKQFEEMLECLVNEDKVKAEELFHNIVVEKSREIYENLLEDDLDDEEVDETSDEEVDEASDDEEVDETSDEEVDEASKDDDLEEDFNLDEFEVEGEDDMDMDAGDPADDMMSDIADMGDEEGEGGD
jgi:DNA replication protein DnaC